jgi:hypothetical protein
MKLESFVVKEVTGAMKAITEDGPKSILEFVVVTCRSEYLWKKETFLAGRFVPAKEIEEINKKMMPCVLFHVVDDYNNRFIVLVKPPADQLPADNYFSHGHLEWEDFETLMKNAEVYLL